MRFGGISFRRAQAMLPGGYHAGDAGDGAGGPGLLSGCRRGGFHLRQPGKLSGEAEARGTVATGFIGIDLAARQTDPACGPAGIDPGRIPIWRAGFFPEAEGGPSFAGKLEGGSYLREGNTGLHPFLYAAAALEQAGPGIRRFGSGLYPELCAELEPVRKNFSY